MATIELPDGQKGDLLYHDGTSWVLLEGPTADSTVLDGMLITIDSAGIPKWDFVRVSSNSGA